MAADPHLPSPGDVIAGKYRVERLIGRGGMGAVFAAQHMLLNQRVALKLLLGELAENPEATARFMNEARAAARIQGEHVARVLDIGQLPSGAPFMVMEYLEGSDLADVLSKRGTLTVPEVADFALQALDALAQAHAAGIVHRDLKPANLFLARRHDGTNLVKVLDFGISKNLTPVEGQAHGMTSTRAVLGSPEYMSPEQLRTPRDVDTRTDIWSLGVILYELLTGQMPYRGESLAELFVSILETVPPPVRAIRPDVPAALEAVVARCMTRDRNGRYQAVGELAAALMTFASEQTRAIAAARGSAPGLPSRAPVAPTLPMVSTANTAAPNTAAPWANTGAGATPEDSGRRTRVVALLGVGVLFLLVGIVAAGALVNKLRTGEPATQVPEAMPVAAAPGPLAPVAPIPSVPPAAASARDAAPLVPRPPAPFTPPPPKDGASAPRTPRSTPGEPKVVAPPIAAPPAAPINCAPSYYFDKDGNKHFKPECFK